MLLQFLDRSLYKNGEVRMEKQKAEWNRLNADGVDGVTFIDDAHKTCYIGSQCHIGEGTIVHPGVTIKGNVVIGKRCTIEKSVTIEGVGYVGDDSVIGSNIKNPHIGQRCMVKGQVFDSTIGDDCAVGFFADINRSNLGAGVKAKHRCGIRDAEIGSLTNISEGVSIFNYDGVVKRKTKIGQRCFLGGNITIIGGIEIGDECYIAKGARVAKNIPARSYFNPNRALIHPKFPALQEGGEWYLEGHYLHFDFPIAVADRQCFEQWIQKRNGDIALWLVTPSKPLGDKTPLEYITKYGVSSIEELV